MHLVQFDTGQIRQPDDGRCLGCDSVILFFLAEDDMFEPIRRPIWSIFLEKRFAPDPVRIPYDPITGVLSHAPGIVGAILK